MIRGSRRSILATTLLLASCEPSGQAPADGAGKQAATAPAAPSARDPGSTPAAPAAATPAAVAASNAPALTTRTPSGLEYTILKPGEGESPQLGSLVTLHWTARLPGGKVWKDTRATNSPTTEKLDRKELIAGWVEALLGMKKGEKRKLHVPSHLGYGKAGYPGLVPPDSDLDFEIELVSFTPPGKKQP